MGVGPPTPLPAMVGDEIYPEVGLGNTTKDVSILCLHEGRGRVGEDRVHDLQ